jgi:hypothetical protein
MLINRSHLPWAFLTALATLVLAAIYFEVFRPGSIPNYLPVSTTLGARPFGHRSVGATPIGLWYGSAAFAIFIFAALLGARKKVRTWRIGQADTWMRAHIWLSILTVPLVLFHCGFRSGSMMTTGLLVLYSIVMLSGFYGLALQQFIPRQMMNRLSQEVIYDQIPFLRAKLVEQASALRQQLQAGDPGAGPRPRAWSGGPLPPMLEDPKLAEARAGLLEMLNEEVLPYLKSRPGSRCRLGKRQASDNLFSMVRSGATEQYEGRVDEMRLWCDQRRQMDHQEVMHHWLHYWLLVHVPTSLLLLIWTAWHAVTGLYYY